MINGCVQAAVGLPADVRVRPVRSRLGESEFVVEPLTCVTAGSVRTGTPSMSRYGQTVPVHRGVAGEPVGKLGR